MTDLTTRHRVLGVLDRAYRGAIEAQYFDALFGFLSLRRQLGSVDVVLRGYAVTLAVCEVEYTTDLDLGGVRLTTLPDYRGVIRDMVREGIGVFVDEPDLRGVGFAPRDLVADVVCTDTNALAKDWHDYDKVWFV